MSMDLTGIQNRNEYYTNHYFSSIFEENAADTLSAWRKAAKDEERHTPWSLLRDAARQYAIAYQQSQRLRPGAALQRLTREQAEILLAALGYHAAQPKPMVLEDETQAPVYLEVAKANGDPQLWVMLAQRDEEAAGAMDCHVFLPPTSEEENGKACPLKLLFRLNKGENTEWDYFRYFQKKNRSRIPMKSRAIYRRRKLKGWKKLRSAAERPIPKRHGFWLLELPCWSRTDSLPTNFPSMREES